LVEDYLCWCRGPSDAGTDRVTDCRVPVSILETQVGARNTRHPRNRSSSRRVPRASDATCPSKRQHFTVPRGWKSKVSCSTLEQILYAWQTVGKSAFRGERLRENTYDRRDVTNCLESEPVGLGRATTEGKVCCDSRDARMSCEMNIESNLTHVSAKYNQNPSARMLADASQRAECHRVTWRGGKVDGLESAGYAGTRSAAALRPSLNQALTPTSTWD
jgi:hypothetical protein